MDLDDLLPPKMASSTAIGGSLETLSVAELENLIKDLEAEIVRVRAELDRKKRHEEAARVRFSNPEATANNRFQMRVTLSNFGMARIPFRISKSNFCRAPRGFPLNRPLSILAQIRRRSRPSGFEAAPLPLRLTPPC